MAFFYGYIAGETHYQAKKKNDSHEVGGEEGCTLRGASHGLAILYFLA